MQTPPVPLLGPAEIRRLAGELGIRPAKSRGQNFLHDANTVRRIVRLADVGPGSRVLEVGPGLGSLTLGLLDVGAEVLAVELDRGLAEALPATVARRQGDAVRRLHVLHADAMRVTEQTSGAAPEVLAANLPYNVAVPLLLHVLAAMPSVARGVVMVQREVADRLTAPPGGRVYGAPTVKLAWYARATYEGPVGRRVFWPEPRVDSALVAFRRVRDSGHEPDLRDRTFALVDAAFAQRRKTLRAALSGALGSPAHAEAVLRRAGIDPGLRGEALGLEDYMRLAAAAAE